MFNFTFEKKKEPPFSKEDWNRLTASFDEAADRMSNAVSKEEFDLVMDMVAQEKDPERLRFFLAFHKGLHPESVQVVNISIEIKKRMKQDPAADKTEQRQQQENLAYLQCENCNKRKPDVRSRKDGYVYEMKGKIVMRDYCDECDLDIWRNV